jgi:hypothetical protein
MINRLAISNVVAGIALLSAVLSPTKQSSVFRTMIRDAFLSIGIARLHRTGARDNAS